MKVLILIYTFLYICRYERRLSWLSSSLLSQTALWLLKIRCNVKIVACNLNITLVRSLQEVQENIKAEVNTKAMQFLRSKPTPASSGKVLGHNFLVRVCMGASTQAAGQGSYSTPLLKLLKGDSWNGKDSFLAITCWGLAVGKQESSQNRFHNNKNLTHRATWRVVGGVLCESCQVSFAIVHFEIFCYAYAPFPSLEMIR